MTALQKLFLSCAVLATPLLVSAEVTVPVNDQKALDFYKNSQLVVTKVTVNPFELAGCLVLHKDGESDQYVNLLPESIKKSLKPENLTATPYRTMLTKEQAAKVGFLGVLGIETKEKHLLEVSINDRWRLDGPSFWNDNELKKAVIEFGKVYVNLGYQVKYNQNIQYSHLITSEFEENDGNVKSTFTYVDGSGKRFVQSSNYSQRELIAISPFDITPILKAWNPQKVEATALQVSPTQIQSLKEQSVTTKATPVSLDRADLSKIKAYEKSITSKEFKAKIME